MSNHGVVMHAFMKQVLLLLLAAPLCQAAVMVDVALKPGGAWKQYSTRTVADLPPAIATNVDTGLSKYGGLKAGKVAATGFFHATNLNGRWWLVDPEGCLFIHKAVVSVTPEGTPGAKAALKEKFGSEQAWVDQTAGLLRSNGFNGIGAWSATELLRKAEPPLVYTRISNFMSSYGKRRGGTFQQPGHTGYPHDCIFVFDPAFETFCDEQARQLASTKDDPWLLGHFSDNEMPLSRGMITNYLLFPADDPGHRAALKFLQGRHGPSAAAKDATAKDGQDFLTVVVDRYCSVVSRAIKKHDPNHLYLGSRFHGGDLNRPEVFRAAGPWLDVIAVNYYHAWSPDPEKLATWARESGKPCMITEWYAKGMDTGMPNTGGAGWVVKTQRDRGLFYQNFTLGLLENPNCVGWHWFKYADNDPANTRADPSNRDSNKGIVTARYQTYPELLDAMRAVNERAYLIRQR